MMGGNSLSDTSARLMVSISGVRGTLGAAMNPEAAARWTAAFVHSLGAGTVVVGRDTRASGPALASAVFASLRFSGFDVIDLGIAATPTVEIAVGHLGAAGGIIITASHNDERWNALKFLGPSGEFIDADAVEAIRERVERGGTLYEPPGRIGSYEWFDGADLVHIERIAGLPIIDAGAIGEARLKAVVDCVNGAGSRIVPALLERFRVETVELYTDVDAPFPRDPEPRPAMLGELAAAVREHHADIGFATDPDADRLVVVDGEGTVLSEELTLSLAADFVLSREKGPVAANLSTTRRIDDIAARHGVRAVRAKVGEANVIAAMKEHGAVIGGEGNGGVIYPPVHYGRDAMTGMALILQHMVSSGKPLAGLAAALPRYEIVKEKFPFAGDFEALSERLRAGFEGEYTLVDGIRIDTDRGWVHVRRSNTEPVVRIIAEAPGGDEARGLVRAASRLLQE